MGGDSIFLFLNFYLEIRFRCFLIKVSRVIQRADEYVENLRILHLSAFDLYDL